MSVSFLLILTASPLAIAGLLLGFSSRWKEHPGRINGITLTGLVSSAVLLLLISTETLTGTQTFGEPFAIASSELTFGWICLFLIALLQMIPWEQPGSSEDSPRRGLLLLASASFLLVGMAQELMTLVILLELIQLPMCLMIFQEMNSQGKPKGVLRFYLPNLLSTLLLLLGVAFHFGLTGTTHFSLLQEFAGKTQSPRSWIAPEGMTSRWEIFSLVLMSAGLGMRMGLVPFHFGQAELNSQLSLRQQGVLSVLGRGSAAIALIRLAPHLWDPSAETAMVFFLILAACTLVITSTHGLRSESISRLWQSLITSQGGLLCMALSIHFWEVTNPAFSLIPGHNLPGGEGIAFFLLAGNLLTVGGLTCLLGSSSSERPLRTIEDCSGLARSHPVLAVSSVILLLNLAGLPPFPGFWARILLLLSAFSVHVESLTSSVTGPHGGMIVLSLLLIFQTLAALQLVLRLICSLCFDVERGALSWFSRGLAGGFLVATLLLVAGLLPRPIFQHIYHMLNR